MNPGRTHGKPLHWVGSSLDDIRQLSEGVRSVFGFALNQAQLGDKHVDAKPLKGFGGAGVLEIVADEAGNTFRTIYTVRLHAAIYVLHVFQKKSTRGAKTSRRDIDLVKARLAQAIEHHKERYGQKP